MKIKMPFYVSQIFYVKILFKDLNIRVSKAIVNHSVSGTRTFFLLSYLVLRPNYVEYHLILVWYRYMKYKPPDMLPLSI